MRVALPLLALAIACTASVVSAAQKREEPAYQPTSPTIVATPLALAIAGFDGDEDLIVSRAEYEAGVARSFAIADSDKDGRVSLIELSAWAEAMLGNRGAVPGQFDFDRDGDDSISREEFTGLFDTRFASFDRDSDRVLRRSELVTFAPTPRLPRDRRRSGDEELSRQRR